MLLDLEFLTDENKRRVAAFGYMAGATTDRALCVAVCVMLNLLYLCVCVCVLCGIGFAGAGAGLLAWAEQKEKGADADLSALSPMEGNALVEQVKVRLESLAVLVVSDHAYARADTS